MMNEKDANTGTAVTSVMASGGDVSDPIFEHEHMRRHLDSQNSKLNAHMVSIDSPIIKKGGHNFSASGSDDD